MGERGNETIIPTGDVRLVADIVIPPEASGIVLFAHGSGSSRHSPRNTAVAETLHRRGLATVLVDLLTPKEDSVDAQSGELRFNIRLLAGRLIGIVDWLAEGRPGGPLPIGLFGASTGAAAALVAAAGRPQAVPAVVSRGGRPDLAGPDLARVRAATLLLVGAADPEVLELNQQALLSLPGAAELDVVPGATHLFEEPGALEEVARRAADWFASHLTGAPVPQPARSRQH